MHSRKVTGESGLGDIAVQVMDFYEGRLITFTLNELEGDELPRELKEYIVVNLDKIKEGRWHYTGRYYK